MIVVTATELRDNQKEVLDKVAKNQQVIVKRGKDSFLVTKITEIDRISVNPELIAKVQKGMQDYKNGNFRTVASLEELRGL